MHIPNRLLLFAALLGALVGYAPRAERAALAEEPTAKPALESPFGDGDRNHWAYRPFARVAPPSVKQRDWPINEVDAFILAKLEAKDLAPSPEADRRTLIRRVTIDLHGLPPTPEEIAAFVADDSPDAYERLVDRLLGSPRYGERWARHWLDLARFAESDGYKADVLRAGVWRYRDYVIRAFNGDKPYDRFLTEQIAGDELWPQDPEALAATGFLRHWPYEDNGRDLDRQWTAILNDVTDVTTQVALGLTIRCARCHDHKYDAILQRDYYRFQAFFAAMTPKDDLPVGEPTQMPDYFSKREAWEEATRELRTERDNLEAPFTQKEEKAMGNMFPDHIQAILDIPLAERTPYQQQLVVLAGGMLKVDRNKMAGRMPGDVKKQWDDLNTKISAFDHLLPAAPAAARGVGDIGPVAPPTHIPDDDGAGEIEPGFLTVLSAEPAKIAAPEGRQDTTGRRATLAAWMTRGDNPLTARVMVNRLWQHHFGEGIVGTPSDFGILGDGPTHPELLDSLAAKLVADDWSLKSIHRLLVTSATYRQVSTSSPGDRGREVDRHNHLLWRMNPRRIEAELLRDGMLAAAGTMQTIMYGESVLPSLPAGLTERYAWKPTPSPAEQRRRSIYLVVKRNTQLPLLKTFDLPDSHDTCARRDRTTTATQALVLMNDDWPLEQARDFAARAVQAANSQEPADWINQAYLIAFSRAATEEERAAGAAFLDRQAALMKKPPKPREPAPPETNPARFAALVDFCHTLFNANEFLYVD